LLQTGLIFRPMNFDGENMRRRGFRPIPDILIKWIKLRGCLTGRQRSWPKGIIAISS